MKLTNQLVVLILGTLVGLVGLVICLAVWADWSDGAIVGMVTAFGTIATSVLVAVRNQQKTAEVLAVQDGKLDTIEKNTNGKSELERRALIRETIAEARRDGIL